MRDKVTVSVVLGLDIDLGTTNSKKGRKMRERKTGLRISRARARHKQVEDVD